jgi:uncharacterized iron-regulated protein
MNTMDLDAPQPGMQPGMGGPASCTRRTWLALVGAALGGCASPGPRSGDRIVDSACGLSVSPAEVARRMRDADIVLLGELHDNPHHHARRAALLTTLGAPATVVAEHLPRGAAPTLVVGAIADAQSDELRRALESSGLDAKG